MTKRTPVSPEVRERAVRMVQEHRGEHGSRHAAVRSIASKLGCSGDTRRDWINEAQNSKNARPGAASDERERVKVPEREVRERRQANEILRKASACFAMAEIDRRSRT